ncbi:unnamed protein product [Zymoseptoria tritici ST99CH_3D1]|nr:unnamed protein product [Zymoseptoria tritici ST99CH_3D1]
MATSPEQPARGPSEPTLLRANTGESILPTQGLTGVDFGAHLENDASNDPTTQQSAPKQHPPAEAEGEGSYFPSRSGAGTVSTSQEDVKRTSTTNRRNDPPEEVDFDPPTPKLKTHRTAPIGSTPRPGVLKKSSTFLRSNAMARKRTNTAGGMQYDFGPLEFDSDSSSEDENAGGRQRVKKEDDSASGQKGGEKEQEETDGKTKPKRPRARWGQYTHFNLGNEHFQSKGKVSKRDGRLNISVNETKDTGCIAKALGHTVKHHLDIPGRSKAKVRRHNADHPVADVDADAASVASSLHTTATRPRLNIVIMIIGSRGDIQPFLEIGQILSRDYGHRVRFATHPNFREFVQKETDLEFFSIGGDPSELMAFMVKNPGLIPNLQTIREGEIQRRRTAMGEMFEGMWRSCTNVTDDERDAMNLKMMGDKHPFIADAIIANPPSMAHVHIAERLGIPLHIMFTFPYSPTMAFPHPLANIKKGKSNVDANYVNFMSYPLVEMMTWQGLGDIVNRFRVRTLGLEPVSSLWAPGALYRMQVPYTYMWSPSLCPKPADWGPEIDIAGFVFMDLAKDFKPPDDLAKFLEAGEEPVYIGFGSIVVDDPNAFTEMIFKATKMAGVRALVNKGWGGLGQSNEDTPENIFMLENTPHDWLFPRVKAVVHHGGAGTTAIGLKCAKPTMIVPFFGDQPFWGARVAEAKAGAHECIPWKNLTAEKLAEGIKQCLTEEAQQNVQKLADGMKEEGSGAHNAVKSFHRSLPLAGWHNMRCSILDDRVAVWELKGSSMRLSALAAEILIEKGRVESKDLRLLRHMAWNDFDGPGEPLSGVGGAVMNSLTGIGSGVGMVPVRVAKHMRKRAEHEKKKQDRERRKEERRMRKEGKRADKAEEREEKKGEEKKDIEDKKQDESKQDDKKQDDKKQDDKKQDDKEQDDKEQDQRPGNDRTQTEQTTGSALSADPAEPLAQEVAGDFRTGIISSGAALLTMPLNIHVAVAQGFHNAPRLWGDSTVRKPVRITGFKSGVVAARKELTYGIYDAWTGVVMQPVHGWKDGDTATAKFSGAGTGVGKGLGGFVLKNIAAVIAPPAYIGKGVVVYLQKRNENDGPGSKSWIRRAHLTQGSRDVYRLRNQNDSKQLEDIETRVLDGWQVYEDIWNEAEHTLGKDLSGKWKFRQERKKWHDAGALENVHTAQRALKVRRADGDLEKHFSKRKQEMELAEEPRAPAMEQPEDFEETEDVLPNGRKENETSFATGAEKNKGAKQGGRGQGRQVSVVPEDEQKSESDETVVATPDVEEKGSKDPTHPMPRVDLFKTLSGDRPAIGRLTTA